ncbi:MAG: NusG domain II-containing protein [Desulfomonilaceae bacterium]
MDMKRYIRPADWALIGPLLLIAVLSFFLIPRWLATQATEIEVLSDNKLLGKYPLNQDRRIEAPGPLGITVVVIRKGRVRIQSSPCPHKTCMAMGESGSKGGILVCLPNKIVVKVGNGRPGALDAVSR